MKAVNPSAETEPGSYDDGAGSSFVVFLGNLLRYRRILVVVPLVAMCLGILGSLLSDQEYVAESLFLPHGAQDQISGVAAQLGIQLDAGKSGDPVALYSELLRSRELLEQAALTEYRIPSASGTDTQNVRLVPVTDGRTREERETIAEGVRNLGSNVSTNWDAASGLVRLRVVAEDPILAEQINRRLLDLLSAFNLERRQSQASAERQFVQTRLQEAQNELEEAERALEEFLLSNRRYQESPQLVFEHARLQRRVDLRQQVFSSLAQSFEQARIDEVRNTPVITVVDRPEGAATPAGPGLVLNAAFALVVGVIVAVLAIVVLDLLDRQPMRGHAELRRLRSLAATLRPRSRS